MARKRAGTSVNKNPLIMMNMNESAEFIKPALCIFSIFKTPPALEGTIFDVLNRNPKQPHYLATLKKM